MQRQAVVIYLNDSHKTKWSTALILGAGPGFNNLQFVSSKVAWVVWEPVTLNSRDQGKVYVTRDGGQHWSLANLSCPTRSSGGQLSAGRC